MSSLNDNEFDTKLDQLLKKSVSPGAEPPDLTITVMPRRPRFNWALWSIASAVIIGFGILFCGLIWARPPKTEAVSSASGQDVWSLLSDGIVTGAESLSSPAALLYTAAIMALVYLYFARRIMQLYRLH